ncbi:GDA1/CD39 (nucleoside phosphatase) family [Phytophthora infestans]|uniref:GDA1/CD39 (Nucleoside phosphatase) family n=1 Tax=Phytophthora infestans TaxID=4787 RepID=A0A833T9Y1_PHYIN|nr:GDA1/CD39 (nucleoside phosphatase) family [Phytophthora infestans]KAF4148261.1 GDA1/CD39 (nucleoside phosphatase) family [Phytophthora infestans]
MTWSTSSLIVYLLIQLFLVRRMGRRGFWVLLLLTLLGCVQTAQNGPMPPPARAHCRVFVVAAGTHTRVLILQNAYEQDGINVYDQLPALSSVLQDTDTQDEKKRAEEAYTTLRPAFDQAVAWLKDRVDPALCFAHFVVAESEMSSNSETQDDAALVTRRLDHLRARARRDGHFPFALNAEQQDNKESVASSGDLRVVPATWRRYFHIVGTNYFSGKVAPSLSPGQVEVFGLLHVDAGGHAGRLSSESDSDAAEMVFDVRERWRRSKRQRQVSVALNVSDFYGREYPGFGRRAVQQAVVQLKQEKDKKAASSALQHPCFLRGHSSVVEGVNVTLDGTGDADKCMTLLRSHIASSNANCPPENFCFLGSTPQPQSAGSFYASGVLREAVISASRVLGLTSSKLEEKEVDQLQLPTPTLTALRNAAKSLCALPHKDVAAGAAASRHVGNDTKALDALCFDLCYTIVLLEQLGIQDADERVQFVDHFEKQPELSGHGSLASGDHDGRSELVAWLTGAFLYLEALQRKVTFSIESELLAEQLSAGLPLGWNMSLMVFVAACVYLYLTTGRAGAKGRAGRRSGSYHRVVNGGAKAKYKDATQSISFIDDARE